MGVMLIILEWIGIFSDPFPKTSGTSHGIDQILLSLSHALGRQATESQAAGGRIYLSSDCYGYVDLPLQIIPYTLSSLSVPRQADLGFAQCEGHQHWETSREGDKEICPSHPRLPTPLVATSLS